MLLVQETASVAVDVNPQVGVRVVPEYGCCLGHHCVTVETAVVGQAASGQALYSSGHIPLLDGICLSVLTLGSPNKISSGMHSSSCRSPL